MSKQYFVAFLDILGFKEMVFSPDQSKINVYFKVYDELKKSWASTANKQDFQFYSFSDSIVILVDITSDERKDHTLKHLCIAIAELQYHLAQNDIWIRGGVSTGEMTLKKIDNDNVPTIVFGKPLVRAYEIESKYALYPRVVIDAKVFEECGFSTVDDAVKMLNDNNSFSNWVGDVVFRWPKLEEINLDIKKDVPAFIDYFEYLFHKLDGKSQNIKIRATSQIIKNNLYGNVAFYEKYRWVLDYLISKTKMNVFSGNYGQVLDDLKKI